MRLFLRRLFARFPELDRRSRILYLHALYMRRADKSFRYSLAQGVKLSTAWEWAGVPQESGELFFGYYDKSPWNATMDKMVLHFRRSKSDSQVEIQLFDKINHNVTNLGKTECWNFQQGAMTQWLGQDKIIYNDTENGNLVSRIVSTEGKTLAVIPFPIQTLQASGETALTLNYKRLFKLKTEYGYKPEVKNFSGDESLEQDGVWKVNLLSGKAELMLTLAKLLTIEPRKNMQAENSMVNHIIASPSGNRAVFMHRWVTLDGKFSRMFVMDSNGDNLKLLLDNQMISHYSWLGENRVIVYARTPDNRDCYFVMNVEDRNYEIVGEGVLNKYGDGHPTYSPDGKVILTDTYPDEKFEQHLLHYDTQKKELKELGKFLASPSYFGFNRCDLHPRFSSDGKMISFDSVFSGQRNSYLLDLSNFPYA